MKDKTDEAREKLKKLMGPCYHDYIDNQLAGDFAYDLCKKIK